MAPVLYAPLRPVILRAVPMRTSAKTTRSGNETQRPTSFTLSAIYASLATTAFASVVAPLLAEEKERCEGIRREYVRCSASRLRKARRCVGVRLRTMRSPETGISVRIELAGM